MPATNQNVIHWQGNTRQIFIGPVLDLKGNYIDLTSAVAVRWWLAKRATSTGPDIFVMKSLVGLLGITLQQIPGQPPDSNGSTVIWNIIVQLDPDDTENVPTGNWYHECEVIDNVGRVSTVTIGTFTVKPALIPSDLDVI